MIYTCWIYRWFCGLITVGAGSAGCVLANRLSEDQNVSVLILEAGGSEQENPNITIPIATPTLPLSKQDWQFKSVPQKKACLALRDQACNIT